MFIPSASPIKPAAHHLGNPEFPLSLLCNTELLHSMDLRNTMKTLHSVREKMPKDSRKSKFS